jgi:DNA-binding transcriptional MerR regulator
MPSWKPDDINIPDKLYFKIGEVSKIAGLPCHVLRFWESEFKRIRPRRTPSGQRAYTRKDIEAILEIRHLLHHKKYTIDGARKYLNAKAEPELSATKKMLADVKTELKNIRDLLDDN